MDDVDKVGLLTWLVFGALFFEITIGFIMLCCSMGGRRGVRDYNCCWEYRQFNQLYFKLGN